MKHYKFINFLNKIGMTYLTDEELRKYEEIYKKKNSDSNISWIEILIMTFLTLIVLFGTYMVLMAVIFWILKWILPK